MREIDSMRPTHRDNSLVKLIAVMAAALLALVVSPAGAAPGQSLSELKSQREKARAEAAANAASLDVLEADDAEIEAALATLTSNIANQSSLLEDAQRAVEQAEADEAAALAAQAEAEDELAALTATMKQQAVDAYTTAPVDETIAMLSANTIDEAVTRRTVLELQASQNLDAVEEFRAVRERLAAARESAEEASARATSKRQEAADRLDSLEAARAEQEEFALALDDKIDARLAEAASLEAIDAELSSKISSEQQRVAAALAAERAAARKRAEAAGASKRSTPSGSGSGSRVTLPSSGGNGIVSVRGIRVDSSIAGNLERLLAAAAADGITLSGGGYRDPAGQIAVRRSNCGSSNYAIYEMPSSSCSPPTARPGSSMHERGLAIDFTQGGRTLNRSSSGYAWLKAHAASYGLYNLPSEPWHWSTNGN